MCADSYSGTNKVKINTDNFDFTPEHNSENLENFDNVNLALTLNGAAKSDPSQNNNRPQLKKLISSKNSLAAHATQKHSNSERFEKPSSELLRNAIALRGVSQNNLRNISLDIPKYKFVVISGVSGSGKSSLAFDTIHAEGQRLYLSSSSSSHNKHMENNKKPQADYIGGLSPSIAIDQCSIAKNPRSTFATVTDIHDFIRILYARIGKPFSPVTNLEIQRQSQKEIVDKIITLLHGCRVELIAPVIKGKKGEHKQELLQLKKQGFKKFIVDNKYCGADEIPALDRNKTHDISVVMDTLVIEANDEMRISLLVRNALKISDGSFLLNLIETKFTTPPPGLHFIDNKVVFSEKYSCPISGFALGEIEPRMFSFNSPYGACPCCDGIGIESFFSPQLIVPNERLSLQDGAIMPWSNNEGRAFSVMQKRFYEQTLASLAKHFDFSMETPYANLKPEIQHMLMYGSDQAIEFIYFDGFKKTTNKGFFEGIVNYLEKKAEKNDKYVQEELENYRDLRNCTMCKGHRLKQETLCIRINGKNIGELCALSVADALAWFRELPQHLSSKDLSIADRIINEVIGRLVLLYNIGVGYITLNRKSMTLSGGEGQRTRLATQIGSGLSGVIYVLDEPSIGLHQSDNDKLLQMLKELRDLGNTVVVVEHDSDTIREADYIIDIGPGAGVHGGQVMAMGTPEEVAKIPQSVTGQYLAGTLSIDVPKERRDLSGNKVIEVIGACGNNLRNISVKIPLGGLIVITGVSGSGKSTFTIDTLYRAAARKLHNAHTVPSNHSKINGLDFVDKVIEVDQAPIGRTPRSNPATYTNVFTPIRDLFASQPEAKTRGYNQTRFSFNMKGGRCEACEGDGMNKIEMYFMPDVYVTCEECKGKRYNQDTLQVLYRGKSIADVLDMTVDEASEFFSDMPMIAEKIITMQQVGLGYIKIGQSATTLSGGEAERMKLAKELARKGTGRTLYILDEPTSGLHISDIKKLLAVLQELVEKGNTVLVIEHNLDVIKVADHLIDFGPGGGEAGGQVVVAGTPEQVAACPDSITGRYLQKYLK